MSIQELEVGVFTLGPRVRGTDARLVIRSNLLLEALTLFSWKREVELDTASGVLRIVTKVFWSTRPAREISFRAIKCVWRTAKRLPTGMLLTGETTNRVERFLLTLELDDGEKVPLFSFSGEGAARTGLGGVLLGDSIVDVRGAQDRRSADLARRLAAMIGAELMDAPF